jgi:hypothetical protein
VGSEIQHAVADGAVSERDKLRKLRAVEFLDALSNIVVQHKSVLRETPTYDLPRSSGGTKPD